MEDSGIESDERIFSTKNMEDFFTSKGDLVTKENVEQTVVVDVQPKVEPANDDGKGEVEDETARNTCKVMQRKLELKAEKVKKSYNRLHETEPREKSRTSTLIPINRLPIPNRPETQPLVEYKSSDCSDNEETFFPIKLNTNKRIDMTDTFSLQEMTIESDDEDGAQNLELRFADPTDNWLNKIKSWTCC